MGINLKKMQHLYQSVPDEYARVAFWFAIFLGIPAAMMWLASKLWWFWRWFGWFGLALVALVTVMIVMITMAAYAIHRSGIGSKIPTECSSAPSTIDWNPWKLRAEYSLDEFSKCLAKEDPTTNTSSTNSRGYYRLLLEAKNQRQLRGHEIERGYGGCVFYADRGSAMSWAEKSGFDVNHIK